MSNFSQLQRGCRLIGLTALLIVLTGCQGLRHGDFALEEPYQPGNIFVSGPALSSEIRRVAVFPLLADERYSVMISGREALDPLLTAELLKTHKFEVVRIKPEDSRVCTGQDSWSGEEALPQTFFENVRRVYGCDAVLFCQLTTFKAYAPLAIGWRMKLVDAQSRQILWAGDEIFDAGRPSVKSGALRYQREQLEALPAGDWSMQNSPRLFGQYTLARLLDTIPAR